MLTQIKAFLVLIYLFIRTHNTSGALNYISRSSFTCSNGVQTVTVPANANYMYVDMTGASSGSASTGTPGYGARVQSTFPVTPGTTLNIFVGCRGTSCVSATLATTGYLSGGYNGGGSGYGRSGDPGGTGGGGASDIRIGGTSLNDRVIVAGGGGGIYCHPQCGTQKGGDAGQYGLVGNLGCAGVGHLTGQGGGWTAGGAAGYNGGGSPAATSGSFGIGGNGGLADSGGGGGGYYGGRF
jgi:hypothetical protein